MKVVLLAGGLGTRNSEETSDKPKSMVSVICTYLRHTHDNNYCNRSLSIS